MAHPEPRPGRLIYLVRHGATAANLSGRRLGSLDEALAPEGLRQAQALAGRITHLGIGEVWTSPLMRARQTAEVLAEALDAPLRVEEDLREMALGPWEGLTEEEAAAAYPRHHRIWKCDPARLDLEGHERLEDVQRRVVAAIERIIGQCDRALCVTHLAAIRLAWAHYHHRERNSFAAITPDHCALVALELRGGGVDWREVA